MSTPPRAFVAAASVALASLVGLSLITSGPGDVRENREATLRGQMSVTDDRRTPTDLSSLEPPPNAAGRAETRTSTDYEEPTVPHVRAVDDKNEGLGLGRGELRCEIVDENGGPLSGADVWIVGVEYHGSAGITDTFGRCSLLRPAEEGAPLSVAASAKGRVPVTKTVNPWATDCQLMLSLSIELYGFVLNASDRSPVSSASVAMLGTKSSSSTKDVITDSNGRFGPLEVPVGYPFALAVRAPGFSEVVERHEIAPAVTGGSSEATVLLQPSMDVVFNIHDGETGLPLAGATIRPSNAMGRSWKTDSAGVAAVPDAIALEGGRSALDIDFPGYCSVAAVLTSESVIESRAVEVPMYRESTLFFRAVDAQGGPVQNAKLLVAYERISVPERHGFELLHRDPRFWPDHIRWRPGPYVRSRTVSLNDEGEYVIGNIPPGLSGIRITPLTEGKAPAVVTGFEMPNIEKEVSIGL